MCAAIDRLVLQLQVNNEEDIKSSPGYQTIIDNYIAMSDALIAIRDELQKTNNLESIEAKLNNSLTEALEQIRAEIRETNSHGTTRIDEKIRIVKNDLLEEIQRIGNIAEANSGGKVDQLKNSIDAIEAKLVLAKTDLTTLANTNKSELAKELQQLRTDLTTKLMNYNTANEASKAELSKQYASLHTDLTGRVTTLEGNVANGITFTNGHLYYNGKKYIHEDDISALKQELANLSANANASATVNNELQRLSAELAKVATKASSVDALNAKITKLTEKLTAAEKTISGYTNKITALETANVELTKQVTEMNLRVVKYGGTVTDLTRRVEANEAFRNSIRFEFK